MFYPIILCISSPLPVLAPGAIVRPPALIIHMTILYNVWWISTKNGDILDNARKASMVEVTALQIIVGVVT